MRATYGDIDKERQLWIDLWEFRKAFYNPEDKPGYWQQLHAAMDALAEKHGSDIAKDILLILYAALESRTGKERKE